MSFRGPYASDFFTKARYTSSIKKNTINNSGHCFGLTELKSITRGVVFATVRFRKELQSRDGGSARFSERWFNLRTNNAGIKIYCRATQVQTGGPKIAEDVISVDSTITRTRLR